MKLSGNISFEDAVTEMAEGNVGATVALMKATKADPQYIWMLILKLDQAGIYGPDIWVLYKDICLENIQTMLSIVKEKNIDDVKKLIESIKNLCH